MKISAVFFKFFFFFPLTGFCCLFEIQNATLDSTCSEDVFEYSLYEFSTAIPPKVAFKDFSRFRSVQINGKIVTSDAAVDLFDLTAKNSNMARISIVLPDREQVQFQISKFPKDFPKLIPTGASRTGRFFFSVFNPSDNVSFAVVLNQTGKVEYFRRFDQVAIDFRESPSGVFSIGLVDKMIPNVSMFGKYVYWTLGSKTIDLISYDPVRLTMYDRIRLDLHDSIQTSDEKIFKIITYRDHHYRLGCLFHNDVIMAQDGVESVVFQSEFFLDEIVKARAPVFYWHERLFCGEYFHINYLQLMDANTLIISARFPSGILIFPLYSPQPIRWIGGLLNSVSGQFVDPWYQQHTPHYFAEEQKFVVFDNNKSGTGSRIKTFKYDRVENSVSQITVRRPLEGTWSQAMGSSYFLDSDRIFVSTGQDQLRNRSMIYEYSFPDDSISFQVVVDDPKFFIYRAYKDEKLD